MQTYSAMELAGTCFDFILTADGLSIPIFISDRYRGIEKWIRECHQKIKHFFYQWHIAMGILMYCI